MNPTLGETISTLAVQAAAPIGALALAALTWLCVHAATWVRAHTKNALVTGFMDRLIDEVQTVVTAAEQMSVAALKAASANGKLTPEVLKTIKDQEIASIKANLGGDAWVAKAQQILGVTDIEAFLSDRIEKAVHQLTVPPAAPAAPAA